MAFADDIANGLASLYAHAGEPAVFNPAGEGAAVPCQIQVDYRVDWEPQAQMQIADDTIEIHYLRSEINRRVVKGETFVAASGTYTVRSMAAYPESWDEFEGRALVVKA